MAFPAGPKHVGVCVQVMSPMKKGPAGTRSLNRRLQALLNPASPDKPEISRRAWSLEDRGGVYRLGDRVMQVLTPPPPVSIYKS